MGLALRQEAQPRSSQICTTSGKNLKENMEKRGILVSPNRNNFIIPQQMGKKEGPILVTVAMDTKDPPVRDFPPLSRKFSISDNSTPSKSYNWRRRQSFEATEPQTSFGWFLLEENEKKWNIFSHDMNHRRIFQLTAIKTKIMEMTGTGRRV